MMPEVPRWIFVVLLCYQIIDPARSINTQFRNLKTSPNSPFPVHDFGIVDTISQPEDPESNTISNYANAIRPLPSRPNNQHKPLEINLKNLRVFPNIIDNDVHNDVLCLSDGDYGDYLLAPEEAQFNELGDLLNPDVQHYMYSNSDFSSNLCDDDAVIDFPEFGDVFTDCGENMKSENHLNSDSHIEIPESIYQYLPMSHMNTNIPKLLSKGTNHFNFKSGILNSPYSRESRIRTDLEQLSSFPEFCSDLISDEMLSEFDSSPHRVPINIPFDTFEDISNTDLDLYLEMYPEEEVEEEPPFIYDDQYLFHTPMEPHGIENSIDEIFDFCHSDFNTAFTENIGIDTFESQTPNVLQIPKQEYKPKNLNKSQRDIKLHSPTHTHHHDFTTNLHGIGGNHHDNCHYNINHHPRFDLNSKFSDSFSIQKNKPYLDLLSRRFKPAPHGQVQGNHHPHGDEGDDFSHYHEQNHIFSKKMFINSIHEQSLKHDNLHKHPHHNVETGKPKVPHTRNFMPQNSVTKLPERSFHRKGNEQKHSPSIHHHHPNLYTPSSTHPKQIDNKTPSHSLHLHSLRDPNIGKNINGFQRDFTSSNNFELPDSNTFQTDVEVEVEIEGNDIDSDIEVELEFVTEDKNDVKTVEPSHKTPIIPKHTVRHYNGPHLCVPHKYPPMPPQIIDVAALTANLKREDKDLNHLLNMVLLSKLTKNNDCKDLDSLKTLLLLGLS